MRTPFVIHRELIYRKY